MRCSFSTVQLDVYVLWLSRGSDRHRPRSSACAGCQHKSAEQRLDLFLIIIDQSFVGVHGTLSAFRLQGLGNEEEWEGPTLVDFAEIGSRKGASLPARVKKCMPRATWNPHGACLLHSSDKCYLSPPDGYCASSLRPHELSQLQDAGVSRFIGQTRRYVGVARSLLRSLDVVDAVYTRPLAG